MKRGCLITIGFLAALGIGGALAMAVLHHREPSFQGRSLGQWMEEYERVLSAPQVSKDAPPAYPTEAVEAIRRMGQPAVDALLQQMGAKDPQWKLKLIALVQKQSLFKVEFQRADVRRGRANAVLCELGPAASNAVPTLVAWLSDDERANPAAQVLASIGRASVGPVLAQLANGDTKVRQQAVQVLGWIGPDANQAVPWLVNCLSETNRALRNAAIRALGAIGVPRDEIEPRLIGLLHQPEDAVDAACGLVCMEAKLIPMLTRALTNEHSKVRLAGMAGLAFLQDIRRMPHLQTERDRLHWKQRQSMRFNLTTMRVRLQQQSAGEDRVLAFVLVNNLQDPDPRVRELSAAMLAGFPSEVARSVPALEKCLQDADTTVRATARRSLDQLPKPPPPNGGVSAEEANPPPPLRPRPSGLPPGRATP